MQISFVRMHAMSITDHAAHSLDGLQEPARLDRLGPLAAVIFDEIEDALDNNLVEAREGLRRLNQVLRLLPIWPSDVKPAPAEALRAGGLAPWQLLRIDAMVGEQLDRPLHVESLAAHVRLSQSHFCRAFKTSTGETPHAYIMRRRLDRACKMMLESEESLSQIAFACGLADQAHLSRLFRRRFGVTPWKWRRARKADGLSAGEIAARAHRADRHPCGVRDGRPVHG